MFSLFGLVDAVYGVLAHEKDQSLLTPKTALPVKTTDSLFVSGILMQCSVRPAVKWRRHTTLDHSQQLSERLKCASLFTFAFTVKHPFHCT